MENEELVNETENVEETTEEITTETESIEENIQSEETVEEPIESEEDRINRLALELANKKVEEILPKRLARKEAKMKREYAKKYGSLENVVNAGLGTSSTEEAVEKLTNFYTEKGITIPRFSYDEETETKAAKYEAKEIIDSGYDDIVDEVDSMAQIGIENMTLGEKVKFKMLAEERKRIEEEKELASIGINELDDEFKEFAKKLNPELSLKEKYDLYEKTKPKKEIKTMGSMSGVPESKLKDYYTPEEISRLTEEDLDDPRIWEAVRKSMTGRN